MNKKNVENAVVIAIAVCLFVVVSGNLLNSHIASREDYYVENQVEEKEIANKYSRGQGIVSKLFYTDDTVNYYFIIENQKYPVSKEVYDSYNIGDTIEMDVTNEYLGDKLYQSETNGINEK